MTVDYIEEKPPRPKVDLLHDCPSGEVQPLVFWPNPRLKQESKLVEDFNEDINKLVADMAMTMYMTGGQGLSAIQIGEPKRVFIVDIFSGAHRHNDQPTSQLLVVINPIILIDEGSKRSMHPEGCLSVPGVHEPVERFDEVMLTGWSRKGERFAMNCPELLGRIVQHEYDHLDGKLFIDRLGPLSKKRVMKQVKKFHRGIRNDTLRVKRKGHSTKPRRG